MDGGPECVSGRGRRLNWGGQNHAWSSESVVGLVRRDIKAEKLCGMEVAGEYVVREKGPFSSGSVALPDVWLDCETDLSASEKLADIGQISALDQPISQTGSVTLVARVVRVE